MADFCKDCARLDINGSCKWGDEYYCEKNLKYISESHLACGDFVKRPGNGYKRAGIAWYIVTKICQILNMGMESTLYQESLKLKDYMASTLEGQEFLKEYANIGPLIANRLSEEDVLYSATILARYLIPAVDSIRVGNFEDAFVIYQNMVSDLTQELEINNVLINDTKSESSLIRNKN